MVSCMEGEREEGGTSRLFKLLLREQEREELESIERKESAFTIVKNNLSKKFSFRKGKLNTRETTSKEGKAFQKKIFHKLTKTFRRTFTKHLSKSSRESSNEDVEEDEDDEKDYLASGKDSAYYSQSQCCSKSGTHRQSETANKSFECTSTSFSTCSSVITSAENPYLSNSSQSKKSVRIQLPKTSDKEKPFGVHLRVKKTEFFQLPLKNSNIQGNVSDQVRRIKSQAKHNLVEQFPSITTTINQVFTDNPTSILMSLSSSQIGELLFNLRILLFSPLLPMIPSSDTILFMITKFLDCVVLVLDHPKVHWSGRGEQGQCLDIIRNNFVMIWCYLIIID